MPAHQPAKDFLESSSWNFSLYDIAVNLGAEKHYGSFSQYQDAAFDIINPLAVCCKLGLLVFSRIDRLGLSGLVLGLPASILIFLRSQHGFEEEHPVPLPQLQPWHSAELRPQAGARAGAARPLRPAGSRDGLLSRSGNGRTLAAVYFGGSKE